MEAEILKWSLQNQGVIFPKTYTYLFAMIELTQNNGCGTGR
jgi:hypothetical protein